VAGEDKLLRNSVILYTRTEFGDYLGNIGLNKYPYLIYLMEPIEYNRMDEHEGQMWWYKATHAAFLRILKQFIQDRNGLLLDHGCGTGGLLKKISGVFKDLDLIGLDNNEFAVSVARQKAGVPIIRGTINSLPLKKDCITCITSCDVLYHLQVEPLQASRQAFDALKEGGIFVVQVPGHPWLMGTHDRQVHTAKRYTRKELSELLEKAGFQVRYCSHRNSLLFPLMIIRRLIVRSEEGESDVTEFPPMVNRLFNFIMRIELFIFSLGVTLPFGGSILAVGIKKTQT